MNQRCGMILALFAVMVLTSAHADESGTAVAETVAPIRPAYTVNPGDVLSIMVWKEADLQRQVIVRPDGFFSFPLVGDIQAEGKSIEQIRKNVAEHLEKYIPDPVVTVAAEGLSGNAVYVIGQVQRPGVIPAAGQIDVMQALSIGGGMSVFAQLDDIKILRRVNGKLIAIPFNYKDIEKGKRLNQNILLEPGDVVIVP
jgi:polysaccharide export outer membrane protein